MAQPYAQGGLLRIASAAATAEAMRKAEREKAESQLKPEDPQVIGLTSYLWNIWEQNRRHKEEESGVQEQMQTNLEARNNEYSPTKLQEIKDAGMPVVYMGLTNVKCSHAEAWLKDIFSSSERPFGIKETPVPTPTDEVTETTFKIMLEEMQDHLQNGGQPLDEEQFAEALKGLQPLAEEVMQLEIRDRTQKMETKIHDQLVEGKWDCAFDDFITDLVTLKAGIIKGPIVRNHKRLKYETGANGKIRQTVEMVPRPEYWRVSPLDFYPSPSAENIDDGSLVEKVRFSRKDLIDLKNEDGYDAGAITTLLENFSRSSLQYESVNEERREDSEDKDTEMIQFKEDIEGLEFWCTVQGKSLLDYGLNKIPGLKDKEILPLEEYPINAIMVGKTLIYVNLNDDPLGRRPYVKSGWRRVPGSFWYKGVPELMEDLQRIINAAVRALCYNMSMASGPQVDVDVDRLMPGEDIESAYPGKVWQTRNRSNVSAPAVRFFNVNSNAQELFGIYENFAKLADDYTGIPAYAYGSDRVAGAGRTSSGLSMLMSSAAKGIKNVILTIDKDIIKPIVRRQFDWNMQYDPNVEIKGDIEIETTGAVAIMVKEQLAQRRMEFLQTTNNEVDLELLDMEGRANVLRESSRSLEMENSKIVKDPDEVRDMMKQRQEQQAQQAQMEQMQLEMQMQAQQQQTQLQLQSLQLENELKKMELQVEQQKMALEEAKLQLEREKLGLAAMKTQSDAENNRKKADAIAMKAGADSAKAGMEVLNGAMQGEDDLLTEAENAEAEEEGSPNAFPTGGGEE